MMYDPTFVDDTKVYVKADDESPQKDEDEATMLKREKEKALKDSIRLIMAKRKV